MVPTATHRFVLLALHVAHAGDNEVQEEEQNVLCQVVIDLGIAAGVPESKVRHMAAEAYDWYEDVASQGTIEREVAAAAESLAIFVPSIRRDMLLALREVAKAHGGVNPDEHVLVHDLHLTWDVDLTARS